MPPFVCIHLALPTIAPLPGFERATKLLTGSYAFHTHRVLVLPDAVEDDVPGLTSLFDEVAPNDDKVLIELGVALSDLMPAVSGMSESILEVKGVDGTVRQVCLSNRMSRFHFIAEDGAHHVLAPRTAEYHGHVTLGQRPAAHRC